MISKYLILKEGIIAQTTCGEKIPDLIIYDHIAQYSIWIALSFLIGGILLEKKYIKRILMALVLLPLLAWGYVQFVVDYASLKKEIFAYNANLIFCYIIGEFIPTKQNVVAEKFFSDC